MGAHLVGPRDHVGARRTSAKSGARDETVYREVVKSSQVKSSQVKLYQHPAGFRRTFDRLPYGCLLFMCTRGLPFVKKICPGFPTAATSSSRITVYLKIRITPKFDYLYRERVLYFSTLFSGARGAVRSPPTPRTTGTARTPAPPQRPLNARTYRKQATNKPSKP